MKMAGVKNSRLPRCKVENSKSGHQLNQQVMDQLSRTSSISHSTDCRIFHFPLNKDDVVTSFSVIYYASRSRSRSVVTDLMSRDHTPAVQFRMWRACSPITEPKISTAQLSRKVANKLVEVLRKCTHCRTAPVSAVESPETGNRVDGQAWPCSILSSRRQGSD
jgi:hypothetical protein